MRFPWVSRLAYDERGSVIAELRERIARTDALVAELTQTALHMKQSGYTASPPVRPVAPAEPSAIDEAIHAKAGRNPALRRYLTGWAQAQMQGEGADEAFIAQQIRDWREADD